ncbi:MAG TPA: FadR/GntR family transcriptional regulator [Longimicrobiaceae bacterium]
MSRSRRAAATRATGRSGRWTSASAPRQSLPDELAQRIRRSILRGEYREGDRLPAIMAMARHFGVGHPTLREALKKLEAMGLVEIRHGSGVYVRRAEDALLLASRAYGGPLQKKLLLDLIEARLPIEVQAARCAATSATEAHLARMRSLLAKAADSFGDPRALSATNMAFHQEIARASGNIVLAQLLYVLRQHFQREQRSILNIYGSPQSDYEEHLGILDALEHRDEELAVSRMQAHLEGVREVINRWDPEAVPVG